VKWTYAMGLWETKVAADAQKPGKSKGEYSSKREGFFHKDPDFGGGSAYNDQTDEFKADPNFVDPSSPPQPIEWLDMSNWDNVPVPTRKWAIRDRVPLNQVGLFSGEGGTGKSIIELMKNVAHVVGGADWLGSVPEQGPAFYLGAEDEADEIHIRLDAIARHYKTNFKELTARGLKVLPLLGQDSMLCVQAGRGNHIETTPLYRQLLQAAGDLKPKNISIDTLSRAFGGDEINRVQVYAFAMYMQAVAKAAQGSVTILSHPSLAGMASGSGISGSTAWHGAFRFRQYLKGIKQEDDADPTDDDLRQLEFKKNQYGPPERPIVLRYRDGLFVPLNGATDPERLTREACADGVFVNLLRRFNTRGDDVSHQPRSHYFAPHLFADELAAKEHKLRKVELRDAMQRLMASNRVLVEMFRKNGRSQSRLVLSPGS
jgi:RecA-family ATPase